MAEITQCRNLEELMRVLTVQQVEDLNAGQVRPVNVWRGDGVIMVAMSTTTLPKPPKREVKAKKATAPKASTGPVPFGFDGGSA
jgi:hypothetical protein